MSKMKISVKYYENFLIFDLLWAMILNYRTYNFLLGMYYYLSAWIDKKWLELFENLKISFNQWFVKTKLIKTIHPEK